MTSRELWHLIQDTDYVTTLSLEFDNARNRFINKTYEWKILCNNNNEVTGIKLFYKNDASAHLTRMIENYSSLNEFLDRCFRFKTLYLLQTLWYREHGFDLSLKMRKDIIHGS